MALTAIFGADFTNFNSEVEKADAKLGSFTASTVAGEKNIRLVKGASTEASNSFSTLATGLQTADKTLAAFGVNIGHEIHALEEMGQASGKTAGQIGLIGTATAATAAIFAGWEIGRKIAELTGSDKIIANWIDGLDGVSVATETAAAKQDTLRLASEHAGREITSYSEAIKINKEWMQQHAEQVNTSTHLISVWQGQLRDLRQSGHLEQLTEDIKLNVKSTKELAVEYGVAQGAVDLLKKQLDAQADAAKKVDAANQKLLDSQKAADAELKKMGDELFGNTAITKATDWITIMGRVENVSNLSVENLKKLRDALFEGLDAMVQQGKAGDDLANTFTQFIVAVDQAAASHTAAITKMESDEDRFKRENDELAKAMKDNFVVIGQSAAEAAQKVSMSFSDALDAVKRGQGTLSGSFQSIAPGAAGSSIRYDDYGNPYGYIPGVNLPGNIAPPASRTGSLSVIVNAQNSFFDTPAGQQRLADKVGSALVTSIQNQGGRL